MAVNPTVRNVLLVPLTLLGGWTLGASLVAGLAMWTHHRWTDR